MAGGGGGGGEGSEISLEFTPTWIVTVVCTVIVLISIIFERLLHRLGKVLKRKNQKALFDALQKIKEELMLLGFISLLLVVFQSSIQRICIPESVTRHLRPCKEDDESKGVAHYAVGIVGGARRLLASGGDSTYCQKKGKVPLLSLKAIHELHIFIFVLAVTHVVLSAITVLLGIMQMRKWRNWEDSIQKEDGNATTAEFFHVQQFDFIKKRFRGFGKNSFILSWLNSFFKQFYGSVTRTDYRTIRYGFIMNHCRGNPKFNFYKYMIRVLESDFKKVVGISWYLWVFVMIFLLLNVEVVTWHAYFWLSFIPLLLLLAVGMKLEHIITELAHEVAEKHSVIEGQLVVTPSDHLFWFNRPRIVIFLLHFILFQNAFDIAFFFWVWTTYSFDSCIMGQVGFIIPRLVVSVIVQLLCSYSTLPLYAIVTQMGSSFNKAIFDENVQASLLGWRKGAGMNKRNRVAAAGGDDDDGHWAAAAEGIQLQDSSGGKKKKDEITETSYP